MSSSDPPGAPVAMTDEAVLSLRIDDVTWTATENELVALDLRTSRYLTVNDSGIGLWQLLERGATATELVKALCAEYDVDEAAARTDIDAFLADLKERDLITKRG